MLVLEYIEETYLRSPDRVAITDESGSYSFCELRLHSLSIAAAIKRCGDYSHAPVMVYLPKSKECIVSFMGILYSGNIYTPVNITVPFPKVQSIIDILNPCLYITDQKNFVKLYENGIDKKSIIIYEKIMQAEFDVSKVLMRSIDTDPVYILFTSGSTGVPKGVTISHKSIIDYIDWAQETFHIDEQHIIGNQAPFYFDNSILDIYLCLKTGAHMHIIPERLFAFPIKLCQYINENEINFLFWVPSALCSIANKDIFKDIRLLYLRKILFCGEVMPNKQLNYWRKHLPDCLYANLYGPTEITDVCTYYIVNRNFSDDESLPIGKPCKNTDVFLLDENNHLIMNQDIQGEICVRGTSLSHGYWNSSEKTDAFFCQNPINPHYPEKIYRTGDLAHYNEQDELIFDGRKDFQIKHLGHRIELGEIEAMASSFSSIKTVSADYDTIKQEIILFYSGDVIEKDLRLRLLGQLPKYMVPTRYLKIEQFPYNDNGKIDRKKLRCVYIEGEKNESNT
jgi:amino acid adenylation domain-containing protein